MVKYLVMIEVNSRLQVESHLGLMYPKGKRRSSFPAERHVVTGNEAFGMKGLILASRQTFQQEYTARAEGKEYQNDMSSNPEFYKNEP